MDDDLDEITRKLADDADDLDLDLGLDLDLDDAGLGLEDEAINLLDENPSAPPGSLPRGGLDYEDPSSKPAASFADSLRAERANSKTAAENPAADLDHQGPDSVLDDDDPMLLLDEELVMDKDSNDGGILTIAALVLAVLGVSVAGFATFQTMSASEQISQLAGQMENPDTSAQLVELHNKQAQTDEKLTQIETRLTAEASSLKDINDRLGLILEENAPAKLETVEQQLKGLTGKIAAVEKRMDSSQKQAEAQQESLRSEFSEHLRKLSTNPPPSQVTASTDPTAVRTATPRAAAPSMPGEQVLSLPDPQASSPAATQATTGPSEPPVSGVKGLWVANLASFTSEKDAQRVLQQLQRHGIFPKKKQVTVKGKTWYRLYVDGFANMQAAQRYANSVKSKPGLSQAWAGRAD
ncbi:MAG: SPOR domain-containing protein [Gammaproteobacteria bacterium]|nr:SPOR domain-containing protein [Gammaproteobacteria bacterium]